MGSRSVLMVDDDRKLLDEYAEIFKEQHIHFNGFETGRAAIEWAQNNLFDVGIVDLRLPDYSGVDFIERLREYSPDSAYLLITAYATVETAIRSLHRNIYDYILKPFSPEELMLSVKKGFLLKDSRKVNNQHIEELIKEKGLLQAKILMLEQWNELFFNREKKIHELKQEVNALLKKNHEPPKYIL